MTAPRDKRGEPAVKAPRAKWLWITSYLKVVLLNPIGLAGLASAAALGALWWMEFNWPDAHAWFATYPVTISLITGLLNLVFTLSLVNRIIQHRDEIRWRGIRNTTLKGLNDEVRATRDILYVALFGKPPYDRSPQIDAACAEVQQSGTAWSREQSDDAGTRISAMTADAGWTNAAAKTLRLAVEQIREGLAQWAPAMTAARGDYKVLVPVTTLADALEVMEFPFADNHRDPGTGLVADNVRPALQVLWLHTITTCIYAEESMVSAMYPRLEYPERPKKPAWTSDKPREKMLSRDQEMELEHWLKRPRTFKKATRTRKYGVTSHVDWPW